MDGSLIGVSSVYFCQMYWERSTNSFLAKVLVFRHTIGEIFLRVLVHLDAYFFSTINAELRFTKCWIVLEAIVNPSKTFLDESLSQIMGSGKRSVFQTDSSFELRILDDSVQRWSNPRIEYFKIRHSNSSHWWRRFLNHPLNQSTPLLWSTA